MYNKKNNDGNNDDNDDDHNDNDDDDADNYIAILSFSPTKKELQRYPDESGGPHSIISHFTIALNVASLGYAKS